MTENDDITLFKLDQVCKTIKVTYPTVLKYIREGQLKGIRIGGQWRVSLAELKRFAKEGSNDDPTLNLEHIDVTD